MRSPNRLRVAVLVSGVPHPSHGASVVLFYHYILGLCDAGFDVLCVTIVRPGHRDENAIKTFKESLSGYGGFRTETAELPRILEPRRLQIIDRRSEGRSLQDRLRAYEPDAIICFEMECAALAKDLPAAYKIVWLGDLAFDTYWYNFVYGVKESPLTVRSLPYAVVQRWRWRRIYEQILVGFSGVVVSSKSSEAKLRALGVRSRYAPYPWPTLQHDCVEEAAKPAKPTFLFFGTLVGLGSRSSFHFLLDRLYPLLARRWGPSGFEILIAGRERLPDWVARRLQKLPELRFLGFVDDLQSIVTGCHAVIAPLDVPVGNRSRILTAMALKALVVAHENAALGNPDLVHERNCLLATSAEDFSACMARAVDEPDFVRSVAHSGYETYVNLFSPKAAAQLLALMVKERFGSEYDVCP
jgi:glycosyltransferase involved in cell wall biosynthesis